MPLKTLRGIGKNKSKMKPVEETQVQDGTESVEVEEEEAPARKTRKRPIVSAAAPFTSPIRHSISSRDEGNLINF